MKAHLFRRKERRNQSGFLLHYDWVVLTHWFTLIERIAEVEAAKEFLPKRLSEISQVLSILTNDSTLTREFGNRAISSSIKIDLLSPSIGKRRFLVGGYALLRGASSTILMKLFCWNTLDEKKIRTLTFNLFTLASSLMQVGRNHCDSTEQVSHEYEYCLPSD